MPENNEDKLAWCEYGAVWEYVFVGLYGERLGIMINPAKNMMGGDGKYQPDLYKYTESVAADLKHIDTPFYTSGKYGMSPQTTVTFNRKDAERYYRKYPSIVLYFWVNYREATNHNVKIDSMSGVWSIGFTELRNILKSSPEHTYKSRVNDTNGNAKSSFLLSLNDMVKVI